MIVAARVDEAVREFGDWVFVDLGFSAKSKSCCITIGDAERFHMSYGELGSAKGRLHSRSISTPTRCVSGLHATGTPSGCLSGGGGARSTPLEKLQRGIPIECSAFQIWHPEFDNSVKWSI